MGWRNLFKPKTPRGQPDPRLRWFGKLPTYADYYCSQTDADWVVEFNDWVLKGCELYFGGQREGRRETRLASSACVLRLPKSQMTVLATIQDYGGDMRGRPFPLCFYVGVPSASWPGPTSGRILAGLRVLRDLTDLRDQVVRFSKAPGRFDAVFGGREIDLTGVDEEGSDSSWRSDAKTLALADWYAAVQPCLKALDARGTALEQWQRLISAWGENIAKLDSADFGPTLRFPLAMTMPLEVQVAGWLGWLERHMNLTERLISLLICKDVSGGTGRLTVVTREPLPEDFLIFTPLADSLSYLDDACALAPDLERDESLERAGSLSRPVGQVALRWLDFVDSGNGG